MGRRLFPVLFLSVATAFCQQSGGELRLSVHDAAGAPMPAHAEVSSQASGTQESVD